jgi:hypothetical protein
MNNFWCLVFLIAPVFITSTSWMNWSIVVGAVVGALLMLPFVEDYKRLNYDNEEEGARTSEERKRQQLLATEGS